MEVKLSQVQCEFYEACGYLRIDRITTQEEVEELAELFDDLFASRVGLDEGDRFDLTGMGADKVERSPQLLFPSKYRPELRDTVFWANATAIASQLLAMEHSKAENLRFRDHSILKPATDGAETPWHQDEAYWEEDMDYRDLTVWMPLQPATVENGCLHFIPASHKLGILPHHRVEKDPRVVALEADNRYVDLSKATPCPLPAGGATMHSCKTLHYASPNKTSEQRRTFILTIGPPPGKREEPRDFYWNEGHRVF